MATHLKAFYCVSVLFTVEIVLPYLPDLGRTFGQVMSIIGSKAVLVLIDWRNTRIRVVLH